MTIGPAPICLFCKRYREAMKFGDPDTCDAFPQGIPEEILLGGFDHRKPFKGDGGVRFEQDETIEFKWEPLR